MSRTAAVPSTILRIIFARAFEGRGMSIFESLGEHIGTPVTAGDAWEVSVYQ
jgi:hypothetical protein